MVNIVKASPVSFPFELFLWVSVSKRWASKDWLNFYKAFDKDLNKNFLNKASSLGKAII